MDSRFISGALTSWKCKAVIAITVNAALLAALISLLSTKTQDAHEGNVPLTVKSTLLAGGVRDVLNMTREKLAEGSRLERYHVNWEENGTSGSIPALHLGLGQMAVAPQQDHSMTVLDLLNDPEVGTTLMQHFRLQGNRIVVVNSSIYDMQTTVLYNVTSSVGVRLELECLKTKADGTLQTLTMTSKWCKGRQLSSLTLGGTFSVSQLERLHFEANYVEFLIGAVPNSHTTLVHVMEK